jgi:hypothetical protein
MLKDKERLTENDLAEKLILCHPAAIYFFAAAPAI